MKKLLFVCLGNICRSPAAEGGARAAGFSGADSAGTGGWHVGEAPYEPMQVVAKKRQIDLSDLRARQFSPADFERFDLIVAMDSENLNNIERCRPKGNATPVHKLLEFAAAETSVSDVPDPYYTRDFDGCLDLIELGIKGLQRSL